MLKKIIQRYIPHPEQLRSNKSLRFLGKHLLDNNLWHINRKSTSKAFFVGVFVAFIPMPFQMALSAVLAVYIRCNLPLAVALVWITNPFTMPVIFYFTYKVGCFILQIPPSNSGFNFSWEWISNKLSTIWAPLYLGSFVFGLIAAIASHAVINQLWRINVRQAWKKRRQNT